MFKTLLRIPRESRVMVVLSLTVLLQVLVLSAFGLSALKGQVAESERKVREICRQVLDRNLVHEASRRVRDATGGALALLLDLPVQTPVDDPVLGRALRDATTPGRLIRHAFLLTPDGTWYDAERHPLWPGVEDCAVAVGGDLAWPYHEFEERLDREAGLAKAIPELRGLVERVAVDFRPFGLVLLARLERQAGRASMALAVYDRICRDFPTALDHRQIPPVPVGPEAARNRATLRLTELKAGRAEAPHLVDDLVSLRRILLANLHHLKAPRARWETERLRKLVAQADSLLPDEERERLAERLAMLDDREKSLLALRESFGPELAAAAAGEHPGGRLEKLGPEGVRVVHATPLKDRAGRATGAVVFLIDYRRVLAEVLPDVLAGLPLPEGVAPAVIDAEGNGVVAGAEAPTGPVLAQEGLGEGLPFHRAVLYLTDPGPSLRQARAARRLHYGIMALSIAGILAAGWFATRTVGRELRVARMKSDFLSNITHELKTPLTSIRMFVETLQEGRVRDEEERQECLSVISREADRLTGLIQEVLDLSRVEGKRKGGLRRKSADLGKLLQETVDLFRSRMGDAEAEVELEMEIQPDLPRLTLDQHAVQEMILNLLSNARKYGGRHIRLTAAFERSVVRIEVQDDGIGIPESEHGLIFEKFYRVDDTLARKVEGTGLGLAFVREVATAHGGRVGVVSRPGEGSRFTVTLPKE